eukprot:scaffold127565_cov48-Attheya_sp.AAC.2
MAHCEHQLKHFTPLVFSVDGMMDMECDAARKRLASRLAPNGSAWLHSQLIGNCIGLICELVLALGPKSLNPTIPDAMGLRLGALTV